MSKYLLGTGEIVDTKKECDCLIHGNKPHWLYMDEVWKDRNTLKLDSNKFFEYATEEKLRLQFKSWYMKMNNIVEIYDDQDIIK